jgi:hypothetical protein
VEERLSAQNLPESVEEKNAQRMKVRHKVITECWEDEDDEVKAQVEAIYQEEKVLAEEARAAAKQKEEEEEEAEEAELEPSVLQQWVVCCLRSADVDEHRAGILTL